MSEDFDEMALKRALKSYVSTHCQKGIEKAKYFKSLYTDESFLENHSNELGIICLEMWDKIQELQKLHPDEKLYYKHVINDNTGEIGFCVLTANVKDCHGNNSIFKRNTGDLIKVIKIFMLRPNVVLQNKEKPIPNYTYSKCDNINGSDIEFEDDDFDDQEELHANEKDQIIIYENPDVLINKKNISIYENFFAAWMKLVSKTKNVTRNNKKYDFGSHTYVQWGMCGRLISYEHINANEDILKFCWPDGFLSSMTINGLFIKLSYNTFGTSWKMKYGECINYARFTQDGIYYDCKFSINDNLISFKKMYANDSFLLWHDYNGFLCKCTTKSQKIQNDFMDKFKTTQFYEYLKSNEWEKVDNEEYDENQDDEECDANQDDEEYDEYYKRSKLHEVVKKIIDDNLDTKIGFVANHTYGNRFPLVVVKILEENNEENNEKIICTEYIDHFASKIEIIDTLSMRGDSVIVKKKKENHNCRYVKHLENAVEFFRTVWNERGLPYADRDE